MQVTLGNICSITILHIHNICQIDQGSILKNLFLKSYEENYSTTQQLSSIKDSDDGQTQRWYGQRKGEKFPSLIIGI